MLAYLYARHPERLPEMKRVFADDVLPSADESVTSAMKADEGYIEVPGGRVWYRAVGEETGATPLLCLHGGPGFTHYYLEPLEALAEHRRVIFYDQLGCGRSDHPDDLRLWTVDRFVEELAQVRAALHLDQLHLFGSSWGGMLAMQYTLDRRPDLAEPDPVRQPGQHDPLGRRLRGTAG